MDRHNIIVKGFFWIHWTRAMDYNCLKYLILKQQFFNFLVPTESIAFVVFDIRSI